MAEIVNLRQARKRAVRDAASAKADANRATFGLSKQLRRAAQAEQASRAARHDGHLLDRGLNKATGGETPDTTPPDDD